MCFVIFLTVSHSQSFTVTSTLSYTAATTLLNGASGKILTLFLLFLKAKRLNVDGLASQAPVRKRLYAEL